MRQETFETRNASLWDQYESILKQCGKKISGRVNLNNTDFPFLYRKICNHYAIALTRQYSPALVTRLHTMIMDGHKLLYKKSSFQLAHIIVFFSQTFPATFRKNIVYFIVALTLFLVPAIGTGVSCYIKQDLIYSIMSESQVSDFEFMYDPANKKYGRSEKTHSEKNVMMFGFYIKNNISIGFRTFAGGMLVGIGSVFYLMFNGILLGGVSGHVTRLGFTQTFWPFVSGHGAFELTAIVISGMAGLILAKAIIAPGNFKRTDALKISAPSALHLMIGAAAMLLMAAFIEAFWSPARIPPGFKYLAAGCLWFLVILYLSLAGKRKEASRQGLLNKGQEPWI